MSHTEESLAHKTYKIPIGDIVVDPALQVRGALDMETVENYRVIIREQGTMDKLVLWFDRLEGGKKSPLRVGEGFHRLEAYRMEGVEVIPCEMKEGSTSEAIWHAMKRNGHHGKPMTNAEKRFAASMAVMDPVIAIKKDTEIANQIGCSASLVSEARRGITPDTKAARQEERQQQSESRPPSNGSGKRETESTAPTSSTARQRRPAEPKGPNKKQALRQIEEWITSGLIDEADVAKQMSGKKTEYREITVAGELAKLKVVGKQGHTQIDIEVVVKEVGPQLFIMRNEGRKVLQAEG